MARGWRGCCRVNKYTVTVAWTDKLGRLPCSMVAVVDDSMP